MSTAQGKEVWNDSLITGPALVPSQESYLYTPPTAEYKNPLYLPLPSSIPHQHRSRKAYTSQLTSPPLASFRSIFPLYLKLIKEAYRTFFYPTQIPKNRMQFTTYILAAFTLISAALATPVGDLVERDLAWCGDQQYDTTKVPHPLIPLPIVFRMSITVTKGIDMTVHLLPQ